MIDQSFNSREVQWITRLWTLTVLCMQQNGAAISAGIINRVIAGCENRWSADNRASCRRGDDLQADFTVRGHGLLPGLTVGSATELSATNSLAQRRYW